MSPQEKLNWKILDTADDVAQACAARILEHAERSVEQRGEFHLVLAGGTTPRHTYEILARRDIDWSSWFFYYGDERCLPVSHEERNSVMAQRAWLSRVVINKAQHFPVPAELGAGQGAEKYLEMIGKNRVFDLVLLGMGEDGHTASLFPNQPWQANAKMIPVYDSPKPPAERVSMGPALLQAAEARLFIITGKGKADALRRWRENADIPIKLIARPGDSVFVDRSAWGKS